MPAWSKTFVLVPGNCIFACIALFFLLFLGWISATRIVRPLVRPTPEEARSEVFRNAKLPVVALCLLLLFSPFLAGLAWLWRRPAFLTVQDSGEWVLRNGLFLGFQRIPPETVRALEASLEHGVDEDGTPYEHVFSGSLRISFPDTNQRDPLVVEVQAMGDDAKGHPNLYANLGYDRICAVAPGAPGRFIAPPHRFGPDGPVPAPGECHE